MSEERVPIGSVLDGRYRVDAVLGTGGMGRVYRAEHTGIGRAVAIKVLHADLTRNREAAARFQREAIASGRLDHPNIVGVTDSGVLDDGSCYLVMEVLEGESLGERLTRDKRIPWREAVDVLRDVLLGLRHAHDRGVVHRDIKPDNIFLARKDGDVVVKILDFGIAKLYAGSADDPASTRAGLTVGTPAYLSPEQAVGGDITPASDLYSSSIVLYEMIAGRAPFEDRDPLAMLGAHVSKAPPSLAEIAPGVEVPAALEDILQRGLAKRAVERIASAIDYLALLDGIAPAGFAPPHISAIATPAVGMSSLEAFASSADLPIAHAIVAPSELSIAPAVPIAPPSAEALGVMPTQSLTPVPALPSLFALDALPPATRAVSLADVAEPIPRRWLIVSAIVVGAAILLAIILAIASHVGGKQDLPAAPPVTAIEPAKPAPAPVPAPAPAPVPAPAVTPPDPEPEEKTVDPDAQFKALLHDLEAGRTCGERRAAIPKLVALGDVRAIPPLRRARARMVGGVLGIGQDNANACLVRDVDKAVKTLTPPPAPKKK